MPERIQRRRTKGWRKPEGAVCVTRPGRYGNPFRVGAPPVFRGIWELDPYLKRQLTATLYDLPADAAQAVRFFRLYAEVRLMMEPGWLAPLRGKALACYCAPGAACHADVLLELANRPETL